MERSVTAIRRLLLKLIMKVKVQKSGLRGGGVLKRATGTDRPVIESIADYSHMMNAGLSR